MAEDVAVRPECPWEDLAYGRDGLVTVVVEAADGGRVLMVAHADREAVRRTVAERRAWFFSRSRGRLWRKGETSGHALDVLEVRWDCDADALLYRVRAHGPACHTGAASCFYRGESGPGESGPGESGPGESGPGESGPGESGRGEGGGEDRRADAAGDGGPGPGAQTLAARGALPGSAPAAVEAGGGSSGGAQPGGGTAAGPLAGASLGAVLDGLTAVVAARQRELPAGSYVADLLRAGGPRSLQKLGEEAVEAVIAGVAATTGGAGQRAAAVGEFADLVLHALIALTALGIAPQEVAAELEARHRLRPARGEGAV